MSEMKRHIGKLKNTDRRVVVAYMQIPGRENHALVIDTDALPQRYLMPLMKVVESEEGQQKINLGDLLGVRIMSDTGRDMMNTLHHEGYLSPVPAEMVIMYPKPNMPVPLPAITSQFATPGEPVVEAPVEPVKFNPYGSAKTESDSRAMEFTAKNLLVEAELLESEAQKKRNQAYTYAPHLAQAAKYQPKAKEKELEPEVLTETKVRRPRKAANPTE
jgi:hypothetical protein